MDITREAFFLDSPRGRRFCIATGPVGPAVGSMLYLPPFAEEVNKSRRMAALAARAFAAHGWLVLQPDLAGCGESDGDFGEAGWHDWLDDVSLAWSWLTPRATGRRVLWSLRAGSLLAADWLRTTAEQPQLMLWQPVFNGRQHLTQFLRLKAANEMLAEADARATMARVRGALDQGETVEVAGYAVAPALARGMEAAVFALPGCYVARVDMIEVATGAGERPEPSPSLATQQHKLGSNGTDIGVHVVAGLPFWQAQEIEEAPALIDLSLVVLDGATA